MSQSTSPLSGEVSSGSLRHRGRWWVAAVVFLAICIAVLLWFGRVVLIAPRIMDPGESWTDQWGTTYTVVSRETLDRVGNKAPQQGAVFIRCVVQIDNYSIGYDVGEAAPSSLDTSSVPRSASSFDLVGDQGQYWTRANLDYPPGEKYLADISKRPLLRSQQVVTYFEVPADQVDQIVGLVDRGDRRTPYRFPVIR